ncbi:MAG: cytochrome b/b6 domain-containing protein [Pseudomonadota bacterium]
MTIAIDQARTSQVADTDRRYTSLAIILHWVIAFAIFFQMTSGKWMVSAGAAATPWVFTTFQIHKTVGISILALTLARIIWRLANPAPALPGGMKRWEISVSKLTHVAFYALLVIIPLTGWAMASVSPTGVPTFFLLLESLPFAHIPFGAMTLEMRHSVEVLFKQAHANLSLLMGVLIFLHIAAALKHQFVARDNLIARMLISARTTPISIPSFATGCVALGSAFLLVAGGIAWGIAQKSVTPAATETETETVAAAAASADAWIVDQDQSQLGFTLTFSGNPVTGMIANWSADVIFEPSALDQARAEVTIDMASMTLSDGILQAQSAGGDGFDTANHPTATFFAENFEAADDGTFIADGTLTLRGVSVPAPVAFSFEETDGVASVSGSVELNRIDFGIGAVSAADEAWIKHAVLVELDLVATRP